MPITLEWEDEARTLLMVHFSGFWTWDDYFAMQEEATKLFDAAAHTINAIWTRDEIGHSPDGMVMRLGELGKKAVFLTHEHAGLMVVVNPGPLQESMLNVYVSFFRQYRDKLLFAGSIEEAHALIAAQE